MSPFNRGKKAKTNLPTEAPDITSSQDVAGNHPQQESASSTSSNAKAEEEQEATSQRLKAGRVHSQIPAKDASARASEAGQNQYGRTWPRTPSKALPVTQLATESISAGSEALSKTTSKVKSATGSMKSVSRPPSLYMSPGASSRSLPITGGASKVHVSTPKLGETLASDETDDRDQTTAGQRDGKATQPGDPSISSTKEESGEPEHKEGQSKTQHTTGDQAATTSPGWMGWIPGYRATGTHVDDPNNVSQGTNSKDLPNTSENAISKLDSAATRKITQSQAGETSASDPVTGDTQVDAQKDKDEAPRPKSWFGLWSGDASTKSDATNDLIDNSKSKIDTDLALRAAAPQQTQALDDAEQTPEAQAAATSVAAATASDSQGTKVGENARHSGWSFWSRTVNTEQDPNKSRESVHDKEEPSSLETQNVVQDPPKNNSPSKKRERPISSEVTDEARVDKISKQSQEGKTSATAAVNVLPAETPAQAKARLLSRKEDAKNFLLPSLNETLHLIENAGLLERLARYFFSPKEERAKHLNLVKETPKVKHALAIGVHGYFPAPLIRSVIGQPRGTSVRFANNAAEAIGKWCTNHGSEPKIEKIALEGEGKIEERIDLLWKLLIKHIEVIREADFVLVACHSQGVPVAVQLVAKLINFGCLNTARVGICAMAGINQGPFIDYKSNWIGGSAGELFEFANTGSKCSVDYEAALDTVLKAGVKMVLVGSIDDQLVSMESATFGIAEHPCLYRAVFINGQVHAPTFLVHLVGFALKLRNLGISDHGLIRELSNSLSGSFTGDGHSRLYEDQRLYDLTIDFALSTTACTDVPLNIRKSGTAASQNPYILPFAMRGVLEENVVKSELHSEMSDLLQQFDDWKPVTKTLKDVKFRLEGVRSKI